MPPKRIKKPKQKPKQKQKQKQIVKQNVKVTVQSSGGSGGGGSPSYIPQQYTDTRQLGLLDEIARSVRRAPEVAPVAAPVRARTNPRSFPEENVPNPANDAATVNAVFNAPINLNKPEELGLNDERPITRKRTKPQKIQRQKSESELSPEASGLSTSEAGYTRGEESGLSTSEAGYTRREMGYETAASAFEEPQALGYGFPSTAFARTPYGKIVPKFGESVEPSLASVAMGGGEKEQPVFSGFSVFKSGSRM